MKYDDGFSFFISKSFQAKISFPFSFFNLQMFNDSEGLKASELWSKTFVDKKPFYSL